MKKVSSKKIKNKKTLEPLVLNGNFFFWFIFLIYHIYVLYIFFVSDIYQSILVRRFEIEGSHLFYFLRIVMNSLKIFLLVYIVSNFNKWFAVVFLATSLYVEFMGGIGRFIFLINFLVIILIITGMKAKKTAWFVFFGSALFIPIFIDMKSILFSIATNQNLLLSYAIDKYAFIANFGHPVISVMEVEGLVDLVGYRYFYDYIHGFLFYLKVFGLDFGYSLTYYNTYNLLGMLESLVPPGYLAFGYVQLGFPGVFISGMFYRFVGYLFEKIIILYNIKSEALIFFFAFFAANTFYHGEIRVMVMSVFILILFMFAIYPVKNLKVRLKKN